MRVDTTGMTWDELEAAGLDDCGLPLDECPGLPKPEPLASWKSRRPIEIAFGHLGGTWSESQFAARGLPVPNYAQVDDVEIERTMAVLELHEGNRHAAAKQLGVANSTIYWRIRQARNRGITVPTSVDRRRRGSYPRCPSRPTGATLPTATSVRRSRRAAAAGPGGSGSA